MKTLVTGASGFLGSNLVKKLLENGDEVYAMVRKTSNLRRLKEVQDKIELRYASLQDKDSLREALGGIDRVYHLAANVRIGSFKKKQIYRDNVLGSQNVFNTALELKTPEVIYISSISIFGSATEDIVKEQDVNKGKIMSTYGETKLASYYSFKKAYNDGLNIKAAIPSNIFGPDDPNFGPLFKNYVQKHLKIMAGNLNANMGMIFIDDVCTGIIRVAENGKPGQSYILNSENLTLGEMLKLAETITGIKAPRYKVPKPIIKSAAVLSDLAGRIVRHYLILNRQSANLLYTSHPIFDSSKAQKELGWSSTPFEDAYKTTLDWYLEKYGKKKIKKSKR